jgi:hypothetical protein
MRDLIEPAPIPTLAETVAAYGRAIVEYKDLSAKQDQAKRDYDAACTATRAANETVDRLRREVTERAEADARLTNG